ncbi:MAG: TetR/AcrR family transcriptional regulator [Desulfobacteraceae bacterium]|nr:TetR/AcrR family transcriptional regulator [Desulfobacteraceae bacterium]
MKETINDVSIDLFYEKGYFATSVSEIAKRCGIQKASIYYYYSSKEHILYNIHKTTLDDLTDYLKQGVAAADDVEAQLRNAVRNHVHFHLTRQKETFIANSELRGLTEDHYQNIVAKRDEYERMVQQIISNGCKQAIFAKEDVKILSYAILTLCTSGAIWFKPNGRLSVDDIAGIYEKFVIRGLKDGGGVKIFSQTPASEP